MMNEFTIKEDKIYTTIKALVSRDKKTSVSEVASIAEVSPASVIKLAKKLGYTGFTEMYLSLKLEQKPSQTIDINVDVDGTLSYEDAQKIVQSIDSYFDSLNTLDVVIISVGICDSAADYLRNGLSNLGINSLNHTQFNKRTEHGVGIIFSESGLVPYREAKDLKNLGYRIISLTSVATSPLAKISNEIIEVQSNSSKVIEYIPNLFTANLYVLSAAILDLLKSK